MTKLLHLVDPFESRDKIKIPKLLLLGTNDPYWVVDSSSLYFDKLQGESSIYYTPTKGHDVLDEERTQTNLANWIVRFAEKVPTPALKWGFATEGNYSRVSVESSEDISEAFLWEATSESKDFRESIWKANPITLSEKKRILGKTTVPESGWKAYYVELKFDKLNSLSLSTEINVVKTDGEGTD